MTDEQRALIIGRAADKTVDRSAAALYAICETERFYTRPAPRLIGWRTENFLWETDDVDKARNWEPNIGVLPIFEGDQNTKLCAHGITTQQDVK
jgi:hypothetical protein